MISCILKVAKVFFQGNGVNIHWLHCTTATGIFPFNFVKECYLHII